MNRPIKFRFWNRILDSMEYQIPPESLEDYITKSSYVAMQYTGLNDRNDEGIYEADIVSPLPDSSEDPYVFVVGFYKGCFSLFEPVGLDKFYPEKHIHNHLFKYPNCEIQGNEFENPDLLKDN